MIQIHIQPVVKNRLFARRSRLKADARIVAIDNGEPLAEASVWTYKQTGFFGEYRCPSRMDAACALADAMLGYWRTAGCTEAWGPVDHGYADIQGGACIERTEEPPELLAPEQSIDLAAHCDAFQIAREAYAYRFPIDAVYAALDAYAARVSSVSIRFYPFNRIFCDACGRLLGVEGQVLADTLAPYRRFLRSESLCLASRNGDVCGALIALSDGRVPRLTTLWTRADCRNGVAALPLLSAFARSVCSMNAPYCDVSFISSDNACSRRLAERLGGRRIAIYRQYRCQIFKI